MIETTSLFPLLDQKLISLLRSLSPNEWNKNTIAKLWTVKDIAAHLLDGNLRMLSLSRDRHPLQPDGRVDSYSDLVEYLNHLNAEWVTAAKRLSPEVLIQLLEETGSEYSKYVHTINLNDDAIHPVSWAGEKVSKNWFHIAREYTEKWHHQQQIREATGKQEIMTRRFFYPVMQTFMYGLPYTYRNTPAPTGTTVQITISTELGGSWFVSKSKTGWKLSGEVPASVHACVTLPPEIAWKLFTKGIAPASAMSSISINGNTELAKVALTLIAVMA